MIRNKVDPLRVIIREAFENEEVAVDPFDKLSLPQGSGKRKRVADRTEAETLLNTLPETERPVWATAFYVGLRRAELRALRWSDIEIAGNESEIRVRRVRNVGKAERVGGKSDAATRDIPLPDKLRRILVEHKLRSGRGGDDLVLEKSMSRRVRRRAFRRTSRSCPRPSAAGR